MLLGWYAKYESTPANNKVITFIKHYYDTLIFSEGQKSHNTRLLHQMSLNVRWTARKCYKDCLLYFTTIHAKTSATAKYNF